MTAGFPFNTPDEYAFDPDAALRHAIERQAAMASAQHLGPFDPVPTLTAPEVPLFGDLDDEWSTATDAIEGDCSGLTDGAPTGLSVEGLHRDHHEAGQIEQLLMHSSLGQRTGAISLTELLATPPPPPNYLLDSLWRAGEHAVLSAPRAVGKSWAALQLAVAVATGGDFLGFHVPAPHRVLYVSTELTDGALHGRFSQLEVPGHALGRIHVYAQGDLRLRTTSIQEHFRKASSGTGHGKADEPTGYSKRYSLAELEPAGVMELMIEETGAEVVIIDPWAAFLDGNESDNSEVARACEILSDVGRRFGVSFVMVHHHGKATDKRSGDQHDGARGASRLMDWPSVRMTLSRPSPGSDSMALDITARNDRSPERFYVQLHAGEAQPWRLASTATTSGDGAADSHLAFALTVARHVHDHAGERISVASLKKARGKSEDAIKAALARADREGWITYEPTTAGRTPVIEPKGVRP